MGNAYRKLGKNVGLFMISSFGTKLLSFILVPLYTNCLTTAEYGTADLLSIVVQLLVPIFTLDVADAVIRYTLEENEDHESVLYTATKVVMLGAALLLLMLFLSSWIFRVEFPILYMTFIFSSFLFTSIYNSLTNYLRGLDKITDVVIAGIMSAFVNGGLNVLFLLKFKWGINGYLIANLCGVAVPSLFLFLRTVQHGFVRFGKHHKGNPELQKQMLAYCTPLIINGLSWWINNSLDRFFVTSMCGVDANGLLAVSYKIPSILAMFQTIFNQAWTMSAVQEFDPQDKNGFLSTTYRLYGCGMTLACSIVLLLNIPLAQILYAKDFFQAWKYTGILVIAHLFGALSICISGVFNAVKDSKTLAMSTLFGAIVNTVLNYVLIKRVGILGAVIATLISNISIWLYRMRKAGDYVYLRVNLKRDAAAYAVVSLQCVLGLMDSHFYLGQVVCIGMIVFLYRNSVSVVVGILANKMRRIWKGKKKR